MESSNLEVHSLQITNKRDFIISLALRHRLPNVSEFRFYPASGGLASYGVNNIDLHNLAASYVEGIFKGEEPTGLPVQEVLSLANFTMKQSLRHR